MIFILLGEKEFEIRIQQDNATPHGKADGDVMKEDGSIEGWNITLNNQPPNSPDLNILDLGFFNSIHSLQMKKTMSTVDELITAVEQSFAELEYSTLNDLFMTLQSVMSAGVWGQQLLYTPSTESKTVSRREFAGQL